MAGVEAVLRVGATFPDPPFNDAAGGGGLDLDLMAALGGHLGCAVEFVPYQGRDFDNIFDALDSGDFDCVASGVTVTGSRALKASFADPYLISGQALAVDTAGRPDVGSVDDLEGLTVGVRRGDTSQPIANRLVAEGRAARVRVYARGGVRAAVRDLRTGRCDALLQLDPVLAAAVESADGVEVVQRGITTERIAIAVPTSDAALLARVNAALARLEADGTVPAIRERWTGSSRLDQSDLQP